MRLRMFALAFILCCGLAPPLLAQQLVTKSLSALNQCATIDATGYATIGVQVAGTWSATLQPEVSIGGQAAQNTQVTPANSSTPQSTITSNNVYYANVSGASLFLVCVGAYTSGKATVYLQPSSRLNAGLFGGGGGSGSGTVNAANQYAIGVYPNSGSNAVIGGSLNIATDSSGDLILSGSGAYVQAPSFHASGTAAGQIALTQGAAGTAPTNGFGLQAALSIPTGFLWTSPSADCSGGLNVASDTLSCGGGLFDITAYGAACNGSTADDTAFSSAYTAAATNGGVIWVPNKGGLCLLHSAKTISANNVAIRCAAGAGFTQNAAFAMFTITGTNSGIDGSCILDGASQSTTGPLVVFGGTSTNTFIRGAVLQNFGTTNAALSGTVAQSGIEIDHVQCLLAPYLCVNFNSTSGALSNIYIHDSQFSTLASSSAPSQLVAFTMVTNLIKDVRIKNNEFSGRDGGSATYLMQFVGPSTTGGIDSIKFSGNHCDVTALLHACFRFFGIEHSTITGNTVRDDGNELYYAGFYLGDFYDSTVSDNAVSYTNASSAGAIFMTDGARNVFSGNVIDGANGNGIIQGGLILQTAAGPCSDNNITGNVIRAQALAGPLIWINSNASGFACNGNIIIGNKLVGTNTASQIGVEINLANSGTAASNFISNNQIYNVPTGITIGSGVSGTRVGPNYLETVTTKWSFATSTAVVLNDYGSTVTYATLPTNIGAGSTVYASDATSTCGAGSSSGTTCFYNGSAWAH